MIRGLRAYYYDTPYEKLASGLFESLLDEGVIPSLLLYFDLTSSIGMGGGFSNTIS